MSKSLTTNQRKGILLQVHKGYKYSQVAQELGVCNNTVTNWNRNELFQQELAKELSRKYDL
jgi:DNA-directed RNA polymerase specialized sigma subunit, sigma24 homolog